MIRKSGYRFSEKIMRNQDANSRRSGILLRHATSRLSAATFCERRA
jgi:hypothetical protein